MVAAMRLVKKVDTSVGDLNLVDASCDCEGAIFVFKTRAAAESVFGPDVETIEVGNVD